ncbi:glycoside hydrolase family 32 protein [Occultella gossypii]|uniref:beta-fructofuranosidase n=1 Tax=Occultella gossypii TaxID=2800820 RepID=A0ABS7SCR7_9MICO|nr:glycoside hydrolase family 32 protein [Occultella gossypii]MBZ2197545.1 glycoside hydrolase family 32 protein [Occultella gossypii]
MTDTSTTLDPFPHLHIRPPQGWVNDPNGIGHWDGRWHVFYQHNPDAPVHADIHWGHSSSADLLTWRDEPVALAPRPGSIDAAGVWSGVAAMDDGEPVLVYTAVPDVAANAGVALARRDADGAWVPGTEMAAPAPGGDLREIRDPFVFTAGGARYGLMGGGRADGTPAVLVYAADDLDRWELLGDLLDSSDDIAAAVAPGKIWECPQLVRLPDGAGRLRWVLIVSLWDDSGERHLQGVAALVGDLDLSGSHPVFHPEAGQRLDTGPDFYAPQAVACPDRVLLWGWTWESHTRSAEQVAGAGWAGALTFPRELTLDGDRVISGTARELTGLRRAEVPVSGAGAGRAGAVEVSVPAWEAATGGRLVVGLRGPDGEREVWRTPAGAADSRVLVDGSVVEAFAGGLAHTVRVYPGPSEHWVLRADLGLSVWELGRP